MSIRRQQTFTRATVTGPATAEGLIRAFKDVPPKAMLQEIRVEEDFVDDDLRPARFIAEVEWRVFE